MRATIHNRLDKPLTVFGFGKTRGIRTASSFRRTGESTVSFTATAPGTYYYSARARLGPFGLRPDEDSQLNGVIVVDPPNVREPDDRSS